MINTEKIYDLLADEIGLFTGVPDSLLKDLCAYITDHAPADRHIIAANEGAAVAIASGYYLANGKPALVYMQNSGIGNAVNPLLSLADPKVYRIPMLLIVGWRGEPGVKDEPQHIKQGEITLNLFDAMQIPYIVIDEDETIAEKQFIQLLAQIKSTSSARAAVIRKDLFSSYKLKNKPANNFTMSREETLRTVIDSLKKDDIVISTTGKLSRELFEYRELKGEGHEKDFLTVGSMGHSMSIAMGVALSKPGRLVYCLDGDGALIMQMGAMTNIGVSGLKNIRHIVFNNGAHESVGAQPTVAFQIDIPRIALGCGYKTARSTADIAGLKLVLETFRDEEGPALLEIKINIASRDDLGRPTRTTHENKEDFMLDLK
ncbi:MAG: phosphonopyruvate decarboxylase [Leptospirales bacterium]|nr:phosphonopyruvate decarboxylase [Leptospirales bacterium]